DGKSMTLDGGANTDNVTINTLTDRGIYTGSLSYSALDAADTSAHQGGDLVRTDGKSWLDSGFIEGQLIQIAGVTGTFKIEFITDAVAGSGKLDKAILTAVLPGSGTIGTSGSTANVIQVARQLTFTTSTWYTQQTV